MNKYLIQFKEADEIKFSARTKAKDKHQAYLIAKSNLTQLYFINQDIVEIVITNL